MPEPGNTSTRLSAGPQALNRYSYVLNNPLKYTDPSGHVEASEEEEALTIINNLCSSYQICIEVDFGYRISRGKLKLLWKKGDWELGQLKSLRSTVEYATNLYTSYESDDITAADFLVQLTDFRSQIGQPDTFVDDISTIILGERGAPGIWGPWLHHTRWQPVELDDSGFHQDFGDNSNQVRHFWFYVHVAYTSGSSGFADTGNIMHELQPNAGGSYLDYVLGSHGITLGSGLRAGTVDLNEAAGWIRRETMEQGMGIMGLFLGGGRNR